MERHTALHASNSLPLTTGGTGQLTKAMSYGFAFGHGKGGKTMKTISLSVAVGLLLVAVGLTLLCTSPVHSLSPGADPKPSTVFVYNGTNHVPHESDRGFSCSASH